jgi:hypothetical protein
MTADGVSRAVTESWGAWSGSAVWYMTLLCGFLVLGPGMTASADGSIRRWVDVIWTSSRRLRALDPKRIRVVYFIVLMCFMGIGLVLLSIGKPLGLLKMATLIMNFALGFSCFHTLVINLTLLPAPLRPGWFARAALVASGVFFSALAIVTGIETLRPYF